VHDLRCGVQVRLRHEQRRGDFLATKVQQTEGSLRDTTAQLDAANRWAANSQQALHLLFALKAPCKTLLCMCCTSQLLPCTVTHCNYTCAQPFAASRRISEQRAEAAQLQEQVAQLQSDLAASHAAHLALQQHHTASMEAAAQEKQQLEEQHRQTVETLQQVWRQRQLAYTSPALLYLLPEAILTGGCIAHAGFCLTCCWL
jgi:hypothetical protein